MLILIYAWKIIVLSSGKAEGDFEYSADTDSVSRERTSTIMT